MLFQRIKNLFGNGNEAVQLNFTSIHFPGGHAGSETIYYPSSRKVIHRSWSSNGTKTQETLKLPREIATEADARNYVTQQKPMWMMR